MISFLPLAIPVLLLLFAAYLLLGSLLGAPFVPTGRKSVARMVALAELKPGETCMDLGSGTGRIVCAAAKTGATCIGIEINPFLLWWGKARARLGGHKNVSFFGDNLWTVDVSGVDVLTIFFIKNKMPALKEKLQKEMKPGARVVSHIFTFPDWPYERKDCMEYVYRIP